MKNILFLILIASVIQLPCAANNNRNINSERPNIVIIMADDMGYGDPLIDKDETTIADIFKNAGYSTAVVGKWHLGMNFLRNNHIEFIKNAYSGNKSKPFFLYLPTVSPHRPCTTPDFIKGKSMPGERGDMVAEFDWTVGEIMKTLNSLGISDNTLLIVAML